MILSIWAGTTLAFAPSTSWLRAVTLAVLAAATQLGVAQTAYRQTTLGGTRAIAASRTWIAVGWALGVADVMRRLLQVDIGFGSVVLAGIASGVVCAAAQEVAIAKASHTRQRAAIIGTGEEAAEWIELLEEQPELGVDIVGCIGDEASAVRVGIGDRWLGDVGNAVAILDREAITLPIVSVTSFRRPTLHLLVDQLLAAGRDVGMSWGVGRLSPARLDRRSFGHEAFPVIRAHRPSKAALHTKRLVDITVASILLIIAAPVLLVASFLVRRDSAGPALFRQHRVGRHGEVFEIFKFRTMTVGAAAEMAHLSEENERSGPLFKMTDDPRVTEIGRILRRLSIDEIPQLVNVLRGHMSLVGPRPALPEETTQFDEELLARLDVRPGITGLWQLEARSNRAFAAYKRLDLHYLENWSLGLDLRIMVATAHMLVLGPLVAPIIRRLDSTPERADGRRSKVTTFDAPVSDGSRAWSPGSREVAVLGAGYVGLTQALGLCALGHRVVCADIDRARILKLVAGEAPILEDGLEELLHECIESGRIVFGSEPALAAAQADFVFLCVATPQSPDGAADLHDLEAAASAIGPTLRPGAVVINKSTVPVGTVEAVSRRLNRSDVAVVSNPEFLREGTAISDWFSPDRIVLGGELHAAQAVAELYLDLPGERIICDERSAELIKYASNAYLATRLTFVNSMSSLCEAVRADVRQVTHAMGLDARIGSRYLRPGPGWGGSCLPKDTHALAHQARRAGVDFAQLEATIAANDEHLRHCASAIIESLPNGRDGVVGVLGMAFKAGTGDTRESPALKIIEKLVAAGIRVRCYDPGVSQAPIAGVEVVSTALDCARGADVLTVLTEWPEFASVDLEQVHAVMRTANIVDLRGVFDDDELRRLGFLYRQIGIPTIVEPRPISSAGQRAAEPERRLDLAVG